MERKCSLIAFQFSDLRPHFSFMLKCYWSITACRTHINSGICGESNHTQLNWPGWTHKAFDIWGQMYKSGSWRSWHVSDREELRRYTAPTISHTVLTNMSPSQYIIHHIRRRAYLCVSLFLHSGVMMGQGDASLHCLSRGEIILFQIWTFSSVLMSFLFGLLLYIFLAQVPDIGQPFSNWKTCAWTWFIMVFFRSAVAFV